MVAWFWLTLLLCLSGAMIGSAVSIRSSHCTHSSDSSNVTVVYKWKNFELNLSEAGSSTRALNKEYKSEKVQAQYLAIYGQRLFISLELPTEASTLVWLPISTENKVSALPKLVPFQPKNNINQGVDDCNTISSPRGLEVDPLGRIWVLDNGNTKCPAKLWLCNLANNEDKTIKVHHFSDTVFPKNKKELSDLVLDKTQDNWFAYITNKDSDNLIVFDLNKNKSQTTVQFQGKKLRALALHPKKQELYLSQYDSQELFGVSVVDLRNGSQDNNWKRIGSWSGDYCTRMQFDSAGVLYAAFLPKSRQGFVEYVIADDVIEGSVLKQKCFFKDPDNPRDKKPITFVVDTCGCMWMMIYKNKEYKLLKIRIGAPSYLYESQYVCGEKSACQSNENHTPKNNSQSTLENSHGSVKRPLSKISSTTKSSSKSNAEITTPTTPAPVDNQKSKGACDQSLLVLNTVLLCWNIFCLFSIASQIRWFRKMKQTQDSIARIKKEREQMCAAPIINRGSEPEPDISEPVYEEIGPIYEEVEPLPSTSASYTVADIHN